MAQARGGKRAERARETRRRMLEAARTLFVDQGYGGTTLQQVADRAGVAVQTIYFTFGNKRALLKEIIDVAVAGDDAPIATMDRPWFRAALAAETAPEQLRRHVRGAREVLERVAEITEVVRTAITVEPELAELRSADPRLIVQSAAAERLVAKPGIGADVTREYAADLLFGVLSPEFYLTFVRDRGWSPEQWEELAYQILRSRLCAA